MAKKESRSGGYEALRAAVKAGVPANLYIFYGEERYLLQTMAQRLKELLIPAGFEGQPGTPAGLQRVLRVRP